MARRTLFVATACALSALAAGCSGTMPAPTSTLSPSEPATSAPATKTPSPTATPTPELSAGVEIVVGGDLRVRSGPSTAAPPVKTLKDRARVQIDTAMDGENVLVGAQTWVPVTPDWTRTWFRLTDGTFVYSAFVFIQQPEEASPLADGRGEERWIDVDVTKQTATAMIGTRGVYTAPVSTGAPGFPSPLGSHRVEKDGRLAVERMTASQAGYSPEQAAYDVERVLFTQYYDRNGDALHLNYWRPKDVFGHTATSHGCVGMQLHDAQWFWLFGAPDMRVEIHQ